MSYLPEERHGVWTSIARADKEPPRFVVDKILPCGIVFLAGPPKTMKTTIELALALTVAGVDHKVLPADLQQCAEHGPAMLLNAEHVAGELRQMAEDGFGVELPDEDSILVADDPWDFRLDDPDATKRLIKWLDSFHPKLFAIDPLRDFHNLDEKDSGSMNRLLRPLQRWAKEHDACLLVVHHTRKVSSSDGEERNLGAGDLRGTSALFGLADGTITLTPKGRAGVHFSVVLKRGEPWERTIKLGTWGNQAVAKVDGTTKRVLDTLLAAPDATQGHLSALLGLSKSTVNEAIKTLKSMKLLDESGKPCKSSAQVAELQWGSSTGLT